MSESNKQVVHRYVAAFNRGDLAALRELFTDDATVQGVFGWFGIEKTLPVWSELHAVFAIELTVEEIIAEGNFVAVRYTERGKSAGPFRGQPATGKPYQLAAMEWFEMRDGKILRRWGARDSASQMRQMGLNP